MGGGVKEGLACIEPFKVEGVLCLKRGAKGWRSKEVATRSTVFAEGEGKFFVGQDVLGEVGGDAGGK